MSLQRLALVLGTLAALVFLALTVLAYSRDGRVNVSYVVGAVVGLLVALGASRRRANGEAR